MLFREAQFAKAQSTMLVRPAGMTMFAKFPQWLKAFEPILCTLSDNVTLVREPQFSKARSPTRVTPFMTLTVRMLSRSLYHGAPPCE